jgi:hypothetical protein
MNELHDAFDAWIAAGGREDPPRDVALHASGCDGCLRLAMSFDALLAIDLGLAPPPPLRAAPVSSLSGGPMRVARSVAAAVAVILVIGAGAMVGANAFQPRVSDAVAQPTPLPVAEGVLGGAGGPSPTPSPTDTPAQSSSAKATESPTATPTPRPIAANATPNPTMGGGPPPVSTTPAAPIPTPRPTAAPTSAPSAGPTPAPPTPSPTPVPTPEPTPPPTPEPTPTPECSDGVDNDGDGLIDYGFDLLVNDPGCLTAGDDDELLP